MVPLLVLAFVVFTTEQNLVLTDLDFSSQPTEKLACTKMIMLIRFAY